MSQAALNATQSVEQAKARRQFYYKALLVRTVSALLSRDQAGLAFSREVRTVYANGRVVCYAGFAVTRIAPKAPIIVCHTAQCNVDIRRGIASLRHSSHLRLWSTQNAAADTRACRQDQLPADPSGSRERSGRIPSL